MPDFEFLCKSYGHFKERPLNQGFCKGKSGGGRVSSVSADGSQNRTKNDLKTSNQTRLRTQTQQCGLQNQIVQRLSKGCRTGKTGMAVDSRMNAKTLDIKDRCKLDVIHEALITT